jgi:hypothetical protein
MAGFFPARPRTVGVFQKVGFATDKKAQPALIIFPKSPKRKLTKKTTACAQANSSP